MAELALSNRDRARRHAAPARGVEPRAARGAARARRQAREGAERRRDARRGARARRRRCGRRRARARRRARGPLHGLPMTIKDTFETAGLRTTAGAPELANLRARARRRRRRAAAPRGRDRVRQDQRAVHGRRLAELQRDLRHHQQPVEPGARAGRVVGRRGRRRSPPARLRSSWAATSAARSACRSHWSGVFGHKPTWGIVPQRGHIPPPPGMLAAPDLNVRADRALGRGPRARARRARRAGRARRGRLAARAAAAARRTPAPRLPGGALLPRRRVPRRRVGAHAARGRGRAPARGGGRACARTTGRPSTSSRRGAPTTCC